MLEQETKRVVELKDLYVRALQKSTQLEMLLEQANKKVAALSGEVGHD
jgi:hypothetical protein